MIHWLVLTGGASSRLGRDKASTELAGRSLLDRATDAARALDDRAPITVLGPDRSGGPAAAVVSILPEVDEDFVGVLAVDMPFAQQALAAVAEACGLEAQNARVDAWVPQGHDGHRQWLCAVYRNDAMRRAASAIADWHGAPFHRLVGGLSACVVDVSSRVSLLDVDTPEDLQRALDHVGETLGDKDT